MAKPEHLAKIEESVDVWNMWRHHNPEIVPAFWGANLRWAMHLQAKQLCEAYILYQAKLDPLLERHVRKERPLLFENPKK